MKLRFRLRSALNQARDKSDPAAIAQFLSEYPQQENAVESQALEDCELGRPWHSLLLCMGLVLADSPRALAVLGKLLTRNAARSHPIPWNRLGASHTTALTEYLFARSAFDEIEQLITYIPFNEARLAAIRIKPEDPVFLRWLQILLKKKMPVTKTCEDLMKTVTQSSGPGSPNTSSHRSDILRLCLEACNMIVEAGGIEDALGPLTMLALVREPVESRALKKIADALPELSNDAVVRAANLLRLYPSAEWIPALKDAWLSFEELIRADPEQPMRDDLEPFVDAAATAVAVALGVCASCDENFKNFSKDESQQEAQAIQKYNQLIEEHNDLVKLYQRQLTGKSGLMGQIKSLKQQIEKQQDQLEQLPESYSPGYLLWITLRNAQVYPVSVRQGAAWGLYLLCIQGHLDQETKATIFETIRQAVEGKDNRQFCERVVRLLPGRGVIELVAALQDGLRWMIDLVENACFRDESAMSVFINTQEEAQSIPARPKPLLQEKAIEPGGEYHQVKATVELMCEIVPGALNFLRRYPLRLMPLDYHKQILGNYSRRGCGLIYWTRYTPPKDIGKVHLRYLSIEDRSTPNSMGIYYKLFRHPVLVLPIIYHEFLHYGGPAGKPSQSIENETEVLLREIIFARSLIARLAPGNDKQIPEFEESLVREIEQVGLDSLRWQIGYDLSNDMILEQINQQVIALYGNQVSASEVENRLNYHLAVENLGINLMNYELEWEKQITWPNLGAKQTLNLTRRYQEILRRQWSRRHRVDPEERDKILNDRACKSQIAAWKAYTSRRNALSVLSRPWPGDDATLDLIIRLLARRFDFQPDSPE
ncbi:MAG TPA: hypothetical protein VF747_04085 [Blastocatellia bacterium]